MSKKTAAPDKSWSVLGKLGMYAIIGIVAYGFIHGDFKMPSSLGLTKTAAIGTGGIPGDYLALYQSAAGTCPNLDWPLLAGVGFIETIHGTYQGAGVTSGTNSAGAAGPMQFLAATWKTVRANHPDVGADIYDPANAIPAAAHKLCDDGVAAGDVDGALFSYNPSNKYVKDVKAQAATYRKAG